uniref:RxLR effector protein n=1 Tax=Globisporangium ultimum (strain ATCC 200006 / CBS 805.95 / DAOM BR144) TaxID=431595 RepID=K3WXS4_GLOUD
MARTRSCIFLLALVGLLSLLTASTCDAQQLLKAQDAEASAAPTRVLAEAVANGTANSTDEEATTVLAATTESTTAAASTEAESSTATTTAEASESGEKHAKGPTLSSFTGPMIAGAVAIVLIGFVIAFKNRSSR